VAPGASGRASGNGHLTPVATAPRTTLAKRPTSRAARAPKLSKDAYRRQKGVVEAELTRLGLRKSHLELSMADPTINGNYVELRRVTSELADVESALAAAEDAWLELEERAP
jgi:ABC transporter C-terminal domain